jgi:hypothetical protein
MSADPAIASVDSSPPRLNSHLDVPPPSPWPGKAIDVRSSRRGSFAQDPIRRLPGAAE